MLVTLNLLVLNIRSVKQVNSQLGKSQVNKLFGVFCCLEQKFIIKDQFLDLCVLKFF